MKMRGTTMEKRRDQRIVVEAGGSHDLSRIVHFPFLAEYLPF